MREILKLSLVLAVICAIASGTLAIVHDLTKAPIEAANAAKRLANAQSVLPKSAATLEAASANGVDVFRACDKDGKLLATAVEGLSTHGYGGELVLMVGIAADGKVLNFAVSKMDETPGLGTKIAAENFRKEIIGRDSHSEWKVKKDGGEIDAVAAATISSRAAMEAIKDAVSNLAKFRGDAE